MHFFQLAIFPEFRKFLAKYSGELENCLQISLIWIFAGKISPILVRGVRWVEKFSPIILRKSDILSRLGQRFMVSFTVVTLFREGPTFFSFEGFWCTVSTDRAISTKFFEVSISIAIKAFHCIMIVHVYIEMFIS